MIDWDQYPSFHRKEFDSPDAPDSGDKMEPAFLDRLQRARTRAGRPFVVTSGYRTPDHNDAVGGAPNSAHPRGWAADIACGSSDLRDSILVAARAEGFNRIGIARTFIHLDADPSLPKNVTWVYP